MRLLRRIGYVTLACAVVALATLNVLAWTGAIVEEGEDVPSRRAAPKTASAGPPPPTKPPPPATTASRTEKPSVSTITLTASRGDCWVVARSASADGPVLYEGLLQSGESTRLRARRVWLSLGAAANLDVVIDGKPEEVPAGTVELLVPRSQS